MTTVLSPFQLLEINLISAQDLAKVARSMRTYAVAWVHPERKLTTRVDASGGTNPTWNDKFVFRVDNAFLRGDTSAIMIEIYAVHWFRDVHVGTVRVLVGNLIPPQHRATTGSSGHHNHLGMRFVALQVRRPSGRPQGILNVGVTVLDGTMRSMPLYTQLSTSALGYQRLTGQEGHHGSSHTATVTATATLRRTVSDRSSIRTVTQEASSRVRPKSTINGGSDLGTTTATAATNGEKGKIIYDKPLSIIDGGSEMAIKLGAESVISSSSRKGKIKGDKKPSSSTSRSDLGFPIKRDLNLNVTHEKEAKKRAESEFGPANNNAAATTTKTIKSKNPNTYQKGHPITKDFANGSVWTESEVGPSPSEVAAAIAEDRKYAHGHARSTLADDKWSMDDTRSEGLRTKLERWRTDLPLPRTYAYSSSSVLTDNTVPRAPRHSRRHTVEDAGKFSCFSNIYGYECSIVCGRGSGSKKVKRKSYGKRMARAPSMDAMSTYF